ncbi:MAG: hypothetical protein ACFCUI_08895 [Bernardetiaceae bacterium]
METTTDLRARLLVRLQRVSDPVILERIAAHLDTNTDTDPYDDLIESILSEQAQRDEPLTRQASLGQETALLRIQDRGAALFFWNALLALVLFGLIVSFQWEENAAYMRQLQQVIYVLYGGTMLLSAIEWVMLWANRDTQTPVSIQHWAWRGLAILWPPLRMGLSPAGQPGWIWLPRMGWAKANRSLFDTLKKDFSTPMIIMALLIVPIFVIEWKLSDYVATHYPNFELQFWLNIAGGFIWIAFTFEFVVMISATDEKLDYCKRSWIDIFIILLPLLNFFPTLQVLRLLRLNQLARVYRVRGLLTKIKAAFVLIALFQRLLYPNPEAQLKVLQKKLRQNRREKESLETQVEEAVARIRKKDRKKSHA